MRTTFPSVRFGARSASCILVVLAGLLTACSGQAGRNLTGPSTVGSTQAKPPVAPADATLGTTVAFENFDPSDLTVTIETTTTSDVGQPYIDEGKIHLQILVDGAGNPVPCGTVGAVWVRFDNVGGGIPVSGAMTSHEVDLDDLSSRGVGVNDAACGDTICIRAQYITGGGNPKVDTHFSEPTPFEIICTFQCTYTQGFWKTHGPSPTGNNENEWPADVLAGGLMLGTVSYTAAQLQSILDENPGGGNGLISLAHQLIAAKLNVANGADDTDVASAITAADLLIGNLVVPPVGSGFLATSLTSALTTALDNYNKGVTGPGHCEDGDVQ